METRPHLYEFTYSIPSPLRIEHVLLGIFSFYSNARMQCDFSSKTYSFFMRNSPTSSLEVVHTSEEMARILLYDSLPNRLDLSTRLEPAIFSILNAEMTKKVKRLPRFSE